MSTSEPMRLADYKLSLGGSLWIGQALSRDLAIAEARVVLRDQTSPVTRMSRREPGGAWEVLDLTPPAPSPTPTQAWARLLETTTQPPPIVAPSPVAPPKRDIFEVTKWREAAMRAALASTGGKPSKWPLEGGGLYEGGRALISQDPSKPGRWRVTRFDKHGEPFGHTEAKDEAAAFKEARFIGVAFPEDTPEAIEQYGIVNAEWEDNARRRKAEQAGQMSLLAPAPVAPPPEPAEIQPGGPFTFTHSEKPSENEDEPGTWYTVEAFEPGGKRVGVAYFGESDGMIRAGEVEVASAYRRMGVATGMYDYLEKLTGREIGPAPVLSADARAFWDARRPMSLAAAPTPSPAVNPERRTLYRAANDGYASQGSSFAETIETAQAYLNNPGFGGASLWRFDVATPANQVLDLRGKSTSEVATFLGEEDPGAIGVEEWLPRSPAACDAAREKGYLWAQVDESFPEGTTTWIYLGSMDMDDEDPEGVTIDESPEPEIAPVAESYWRIQHAEDPISADWRSQIGHDDDDLGTEKGTSCCASFAELQKWAKGGHADWLNADLVVVEFEGDLVGRGTDGEPVVRPTRELRRIPFRSTRERLTSKVVPEMTIMDSSPGHMLDLELTHEVVSGHDAAPMGSATETEMATTTPQAEPTKAEVYAASLKAGGPEYWWPKDARTHEDNSRCGNCGHGTGNHEFRNKGANGPCSSINIDGKRCTCKRCIHVGRGSHAYGSGRAAMKAPHLRWPPETAKQSSDAQDKRQEARSGGRYTKMPTCPMCKKRRAVEPAYPVSAGGRMPEGHPFANEHVCNECIEGAANEAAAAEGSPEAKPQTVVVATEAESKKTTTPLEISDSMREELASLSRMDAEDLVRDVAGAQRKGDGWLVQLSPGALAYLTGAGKRDLRAALENKVHAMLRSGESESNVRYADLFREADRIAKMLPVPAPKAKATTPESEAAEMSPSAITQQAQEDSGLSPEVLTGKKLGAVEITEIDISNAMRDELNALEVDTWDENQDDYARSELVQAVRKAKANGKRWTLRLTPAARHYLTMAHAGGALTNAIDIWGDQAQDNPRMKLYSLIREAKKIQETLGKPPRTPQPPAAGPEYLAETSDAAISKDAEPAPSSAEGKVESEIEETPEVYALIKKMSKGTKSEAWRPDDLIDALKLIEPGWTMERTIGLVPQRDSKLNPPVGEPAFGRAWAERHNLIGTDFTYYSPTSASFSLVWGKNLPTAEHHRNKVQVGIRATRPTQKELDALAAEFLETLLGDEIIQDADPKKPIPGKIYVNPMGKAKIVEEEISGMNAEMFGKNTDLTVKWKLSNVRKAVGAFRFTSPRGEHFDVEDAKHLSPGLWGWLYKQGVAEKAKQHLEATGADEKEAQRKALKGYSENDVIGHCGICNNVQKLRNERLVLHGYTRPGYGWIQGSCFGVGYKAWELSPESAVAYVEELKGMIRGQRASIANLKTAKAFEVVGHRAPTDRWKIYRVTASGFEAKSDKEFLNLEAGRLGLPRVYSLDPKTAPHAFADARRKAIQEAEGGLVQMLEVEKTMKSAIAAWKPAPLPRA